MAKNNYSALIKHYSGGKITDPSEQKRLQDEYQNDFKGLAKHFGKDISDEKARAQSIYFGYEPDTKESRDYLSGYKRNYELDTSNAINTNKGYDKSEAIDQAKEKPLAVRDQLGGELTKIKDGDNFGYETTQQEAVRDQSRVEFAPELPDFQAKQLSQANTDLKDLSNISDDARKVNLKETGYANQQAEDLAIQYDEADKMLDEAIVQRNVNANIKDNKSWEMSAMPGVDRPQVQYNREDVARVNDIRSVKHYLKQIRETIEAPEGSKLGSQTNGLMYGLFKSNLGRDFLSMGITEMGRNLNVMNAFDKSERGEALSPEESKLLDVYKQLKMAEQSTDANFMTSIGSGLQEMIPFIAQFAATGGAGATAQNAVKRYVVSKTGSQLAGRAVGSLAGQMIQAGVMVPMTATNTVERMSPELNGGMLVPGENFAPAVTKAYLTTLAEISGERLASAAQAGVRSNAIKNLINNPTKSEAFLNKLILRLNPELDVPTIQGGGFELLGEEITGIQQAIIDNDGSFFTPEAQKQLLVTIALAQGAAVVKNIPSRVKIKLDYGKSRKAMESVDPSFNQAISTAIHSIDDAEALMNTVDAVANTLGVNAEDRAKGQNYALNSIRNKQMSDVLQAEMHRQLTNFKDNKGGITSVEHEDSRFFVVNPEVLGTKGQIVYLKDFEGKTKTVESDKIKEWVSRTAEEVENGITEETKLQEEAFASQERINKEAAKRGIEPGVSVKTPVGVGQVQSINPDGSITMQGLKGENLIVSLEETERYVTDEQKQEKKAAEKEQSEVKAAKVAQAQGIVDENVEQLGVEATTAELDEMIVNLEEVRKDMQEVDEDEAGLQEVEAEIKHLSAEKIRINTHEYKQTFHPDGRVVTESLDTNKDELVAKAQAGDTEAQKTLKGYGIEWAESKPNQEAETAPVEDLSAKYKELAGKDQEVADELFSDMSNDLRQQAKVLAETKEGTTEERFNNKLEARKLLKKAEQIEKQVREEQQRPMLSTMSGDLVEFEGRKGELIQDDDGVFVLRSKGVDYVVSNIDSKDIDIKTLKTAIKPKLNQDGSVTIRGKQYSIESDAKGNVISLTDEQGNIVKNHKWLVKTEIERNTIDPTPIEKLEQEAGISNEESILVDAILNKNIKPSTSQLLDEGITEATQDYDFLIAKLWAEDAITRLEEINTPYALNTAEGLYELLNILEDEFTGENQETSVNETEQGAEQAPEQAGLSEYQLKQEQKRELEALDPASLTLDALIALYFINGGRIKSRVAIKDMGIKTKTREWGEILSKVNNKTGLSPDKIIESVVGVYSEEMQEEIKGAYGNRTYAENHVLKVLTENINDLAGFVLSSTQESLEQTEAQAEQEYYEGLEKKAEELEQYGISPDIAANMVMDLPIAPEETSEVIEDDPLGDPQGEINFEEEATTVIPTEQSVESSTELTEVEINTIIKNEVTYTDEDGNPCAADGGRFKDNVIGTNWKIVKYFEGMPKHSQGGVDIEISDKGVRITDKDNKLKAANGLVIPSKAGIGWDIDDINKSRVKGNIDGDVYTMGKGDTLIGIARAAGLNDVKYEDIVRLNPKLASSYGKDQFTTIPIGTTFKLPRRNIATPTPLQALKSKPIDPSVNIPPVQISRNKPDRKIPPTLPVSNASKPRPLKGHSQMFTNNQAPVVGANKERVKRFREDKKVYHKDHREHKKDMRKYRKDFEQYKED